MKPLNLSVLLLLTAIISCKQAQVNNPEKFKNEIAGAEAAFEKMASEKGITEAFWFFADSNAVIKRANDSLIHGKEGIRKFYSADYFKTATVKWSPDFIDVSEDGNLGYTYGKYRWQSTDSSGKINEATGIFHTVWKKQSDGSWKYVWD